MWGFRHFCLLTVCTRCLEHLLLYLFVNLEGQCGGRTGHPGLDYEQGPTFSLLQHVQPSTEFIHPESWAQCYFHKTGSSKREFPFFLPYCDREFKLPFSYTPFLHLYLYFRFTNNYFQKNSEIRFRCNPKENCFWWLSVFPFSSSANLTKSHLKFHFIQQKEPSPSQL